MARPIASLIDDWRCGPDVAETIKLCQRLVRHCSKPGESTAADHKLVVQFCEEAAELHKVGGLEVLLALAGLCVTLGALPEGERILELLPPSDREDSRFKRLMGKISLHQGVRSARGAPAGSAAALLTGLNYARSQMPRKLSRPNQPVVQAPYGAQPPSQPPTSDDPFAIENPFSAVPTPSYAPSSGYPAPSHAPSVPSAPPHQAYAPPAPPSAPPAEPYYPPALAPHEAEHGGGAATRAHQYSPQELLALVTHGAPSGGGPSGPVPAPVADDDDTDRGASPFTRAVNYLWGGQDASTSDDTTGQGDHAREGDVPTRHFDAAELPAEAFREGDLDERSVHEALTRARPSPLSEHEEPTKGREVPDYLARLAADAAAGQLDPDGPTRGREVPDYLAQLAADAAGGERTETSTRGRDIPDYVARAAAYVAAGEDDEGPTKGRDIPAHVAVAAALAASGRPFREDEAATAMRRDDDAVATAMRRDDEVATAMRRDDDAVATAMRRDDEVATAMRREAGHFADTGDEDMASLIAAADMYMGGADDSSNDVSTQRAAPASDDMSTQRAQVARGGARAGGATGSVGASSSAPLGSTVRMDPEAQPSGAAARRGDAGPQTSERPRVQPFAMVSNAADLEKALQAMKKERPPAAQSFAPPTTEDSSDFELDDSAPRRRPGRDGFSPDSLSPGPGSSLSPATHAPVDLNLEELDGSDAEGGSWAGRLLFALVLVGAACGGYFLRPIVTQQLLEPAALAPTAAATAAPIDIKTPPGMLRGGRSGLGEAEAFLQSAEISQPGDPALALLKCRYQLVRWVELGGSTHELAEAVSQAKNRGVEEGALAFAEVVHAVATDDAALMGVLARVDGDAKRKSDAYYQLAAGIALARQGDATAVDRFRAVVGAEPGLRAGEIGLIRALLLYGDLADAQRRIGTLDTAGTQADRVAALRGLAWLKQKADGNAMTTPAPTVAADADLPDALGWISIGLQYVGETDELTRRGTLSRALERASTPAEQSILATLAIEKGDGELALEAAKRATKRWKSDAALAALGKAAVAAGALDALTLEGTSPIAIELQATAAYERGDLGKLNTLAEATGAPPTVRLRVERMLGTRAFEVQDLATLRLPETIGGTLVALDATLDAGDLERARAIFDAVPGLATQGLGRARYARLLRYDGKPAEALEALEGATKTPLSTMERALAAAEKPATLKKELDELDPGASPEAVFIKAYLIARAGSRASAVTLLGRKPIPEEKEPLGVRVAAALAHGAVSNASAKTFIETLLTLYPQNPDVRKAATGVGLPVPPATIR